MKKMKIKNLTEWFGKIKQGNQVSLVVVLIFCMGGAATEMLKETLNGIFSIIVASINNNNGETKPVAQAGVRRQEPKGKIVTQPTSRQGHKLEMLKSDISKYLYKRGGKWDKSEEQYLLEILYEYLEKQSGTNSSTTNQGNNQNYDILTMMELAATNYMNAYQWKNAAEVYYWLYKQDVSPKRKLIIQTNLQYASDLWEFLSNDFTADISVRFINGIINNEHVDLRENPNVESSVLKQLNKYDEIAILERSADKEKSGNVKAYWYRIQTKEGSYGWIYGLHLCFYPRLYINNMNHR